ncbi:MAG: hypothetical protein WCF78_04080, partial [archaeon]
KLTYTPEVIGYKIEVSGSGNNSDENALATVVESMFKEAGNKIDVVDCNQSNIENCNGSFYLTFNTIPLSDEEYEKLPTITVKRERNNEVMQRPVLARQYYKIYMPWRGFQAMRVARRIAYSPDREISFNPADFPSSSDSGLFNPLLHNTLEQARLGVCDPGTCGPRTSFFATSSSNGFAQQCNIPFQVTGPADQVTAGNSVIIAPAISYKIGDLPSGYESLFDSLVKETIKQNLNDRENSENITFTKSLEMTTDGLNAAGYTGINPLKPVTIDLIDVYFGLGRITKDVNKYGDPAPAINYYFPSKVFEPADPNSTRESAGGLGIFYDSVAGRSVYPNEIISDPLYNQLYFNENPDNLNLKCFELSSEGIQLSLVFKETNPKYSISNTEPKTYIKIVDAYTEFTLPSEASLNSNLANSTGYIEPYPPGNMSPNGVTNLWKCNSYGDPNNSVQPGCISP